MNDRIRQKIERLQKNIRETESLLDEWEAQKLLASNPTERKRCEMEITRLQKILEGYESELAALNHTESISEPPENREISNYEQLQKKTGQFIIQNKIRAALELIHHYSEIQKDKELINWAALQLGRLSSLENDFQSGTLTHEQFSTEQNKIRQAILRKMGSEE